MTVVVFLIPLMMKKKNLGTQKTWMNQMKMSAVLNLGTKLMTHDTGILLPWKQLCKFGVKFILFSKHLNTFERKHSVKIQNL